MLLISKSHNSLSSAKMDYINSRGPELNGIIRDWH